MEILKKTTLFRIEQQTKGIPPEEVTDISLSDVPLLPDRLTCFSSLTHLTLVSMKPKLKTLQVISLASFPSLRLLDVSDNAVTVAEALPHCPSLRRLFIANNGLTQWAEIERLASAFPAIEAIDVAANAVADDSRCSDFFALFPKLLAVDSKGRGGEEVVVADSDESSSSDDEESDVDSDDSFISAEEEPEETDKPEETALNGQKRPRLSEEKDGTEEDAPPAKMQRTE